MSTSYAKASNDNKTMTLEYVADMEKPEEVKYFEDGIIVTAGFGISHFSITPGLLTNPSSNSPLSTTDNGSEKRLRWKLDLFILPTICMQYLFCFIDRANIGKEPEPSSKNQAKVKTGNARIAGLEQDLNLEGYDYNVLLCMFYISYILFEIPGNLLCKYIGPGWFLPATTLGFGIASIACAFVQTFSAMAGVRFLLGIFEAAMLPANIYYLSRWYRRSELTFRICFFIVSTSLAGGIGGLLASAILTMDSVAGLTRWRMIFFIEGIITCSIAIIAFFTLTDRPDTARWLTEKEKRLAVSRIQLERPETSEVLDKFNKRKFLMGIFNPIVIGSALVCFMDSITVSGYAFFLPTIIKTIYPEESVIVQQLYTVPPWIVGSIVCFLTCYLSWRLDRRNIFSAICAIPAVIGYIIFLASSTPKVRYGAAFLPILGVFANGALPASQASANVVSDTARLSAVATYATIGNLGGVVATWSFLPFDSPYFAIGNGLNLASQSSILILCGAMYLWTSRDNRKRQAADREAALRGLSPQQIEELDWHHPDFRWRM